MTEPKFTKGEWLANNVTKNERQVRCPSSAAANFRICRLRGPDRDANSHLISAAPELYQALSDLVSSLETEHAVVCLVQEINFARAALAKARGEA